MLTLVQRARQRLFCNELLSQGAGALCAALIAFILLLLLGTQVLNWYWVVAIPLAAAAAGFYRARKRLPSPYRVSQMVDQRMALADCLSTALFFHQNQPSGASPEVLHLQRERAEQLAQSVDVRRAVPYRMPRTAYAMGALVLVASSLFALRYGITRHLDLKPPLASILQQALGIDQRTEQARNSRPIRQPAPPTEPDDSAIASQEPDQQGGDRRDAEYANAESSDSAEHSGDQKAGDPKKQNQDGKPDGDASEGDAQDRQGDQQAAGESANNQQSDSKADRKQDSAIKDANHSGENSSVMSKLKDFAQNLLSRVKPQAGQSASEQQSAMDQKGNQGKGQPNGKQQPGKDGQQQGGAQEGEAQEGAAGDEAQNSQDPQGKAAGKNDGQQTTKQPGSGIGSQDGDKNIKQAEQLAAMGKISEIFGKRSATISGESTVEVQSTSQQLHTPYAQRGAEHSQAGTEIHRDEIPVGLETYVQQYFEQVRKQKK